MGLARMNSRISLFASSALALITAFITLVAPFQAGAFPTCGELFESRFEGHIQNRAARAALLLKLRALLPAGRHQVKVDGQDSQTLAVSYSNLGEIQIMLGSRALLTSASSPITKGPLGDLSGVEARIQLPDANKLVITNSRIYGDRSKISGVTTREIALEFNLTASAGHVIQVRESTTNESQYRLAETYTIRNELTRVEPVSDPQRHLSR